MKRIKIIEYADRWVCGGIEKYIVCLVVNIDLTKFKPMILTAQKESDRYDQELIKKGMEVCSLLPEIINDPIKRITSTWKLFFDFMKDSKPDILHLHICQGVGFIYAYLAKKAGVRIVITHSHNSNIGDRHRLVKLLGHKVGQFHFQKYSNIKLACSDLAAQWLYGKNQGVRVVNIPVDVEKFRYDEAERNRMREKEIISNECVILNIGRMGEQKNQIVLIDLFHVIQKHVNAKLYIIGQGEWKERIASRIKSYGLERKVVIIDQTFEVEKYIWMADVFLLPSLYEGNPVVLIEAQASGLGCVFSDVITDMAMLNDNVAKISLEQPLEIWAQKVIEISKADIDRGKSFENVENKGYKVADIVEEMQNIYTLPGRVY